MIRGQGHTSGEYFMRIKIIPFALVVITIAFCGTAYSQSLGEQTKQYENGGFYKGTFKNGRQHGYGTYSLPNGYEYSGEWVNGQAVGEGIAKFSNGSIYEGAFINGKPNGFGKIKYADGGK